jgi:hypothetical protein
LGNLSIDGRIILICILVNKNVDCFEDITIGGFLFILSSVYLLTPLSTA